MAGKKAKESALEELHAEVAKALTSGINGVMEVEVDGELVQVSTASPAMLGQAIKFLKDNNITADPEQDTNLQKLKEVLKTKEKKGRLQLVDPKQAAGEQE